MALQFHFYMPFFGLLLLFLLELLFLGSKSLFYEETILLMLEYDFVNFLEGSAIPQLVTS